jgi:hypothetical protein
LGNIVFFDNIISDKKIILIGLGKIIEIFSMVEPLVSGSGQNLYNLLPGTCKQRMEKCKNHMERMENSRETDKE